MLFGYTEEWLNEAKAVYTATEIAQQPSTWAKTAQQVQSVREQLDAFLQKTMGQADYQVILTGAGTSEYVGNALRSSLLIPLKGHVHSLGTTDLVASPRRYLNPELPTLLVSFARSGNSPESVGAVAAADALCGDNVQHLFITCNGEGALAKAAQERDNCFSLVLAPETNDKSFAMTSSYSSMYLAALLCFLPETAKQVPAICKMTEDFVANGFTTLRAALEEKKFSRIVYLGTDVLKGSAQEAALKILELTAGRVVAIHDSPMGFRHGPKSIVNDETLVVIYVSDAPETRRYEMDVLRELQRDQKAAGILTICNTPDAELEALSSYCVCFGGEAMDNGVLALPYIVPAQTFALLTSLSMGITTDNPCPSGEVNRVVKGVTIYPV